MCENLLLFRCCNVKPSCNFLEGIRHPNHHPKKIRHCFPFEISCGVLYVLLAAPYLFTNTNFEPRLSLFSSTAVEKETGPSHVTDLDKVLVWVGSPNMRNRTVNSASSSYALRSHVRKHQPPEWSVHSRLCSSRSAKD